MRYRVEGVLLAVWFIPFTAVNVLMWRWIPCDWHRPYR
jgi:hypothetical protein